MLQPTGNRAFDVAVLALENTRQNALKAATTQQAARAADIAFHQGVIAAGRSFGITALNSMEALVELGVSNAIPPN